ncbi:MAG TPA: YdeI/OmpD-associated family protein [Acidimicrobiia bacterium]|nr:YdeI/OmpD-associated family protein [Acidimicrobiia bacterium]
MSEFRAVLEEARGGGALIGVPAEAVEELGGGGRIKVVATFDGIEYRGSVVTYGGRQVIGVLKEIRTQLGKEPGAELSVILELDESAREVDLPEELAAALDADPEAKRRFDDLSYSHRREHARHVAEAKKADTRVRRAQKVVADLHSA